MEKLLAIKMKPINTINENINPAFDATTNTLSKIASKKTAKHIVLHHEHLIRDEMEMAKLEQLDLNVSKEYIKKCKLLFQGYEHLSQGIINRSGMDRLLKDIARSVDHHLILVWKEQFMGHRATMNFVQFLEACHVWFGRDYLDIDIQSQRRTRMARPKTTNELSKSQSYALLHEKQCNAEKFDYNLELDKADGMVDPRVEFAQRTSTATNHWRQAVSSKRERYHAPQTAPVYEVLYSERMGKEALRQCSSETMLHVTELRHQLTKEAKQRQTVFEKTTRKQRRQASKGFATCVNMLTRDVHDRATQQAQAFHSRTAFEKVSKVKQDTITRKFRSQVNHTRRQMQYKEQAKQLKQQIAASIASTKQETKSIQQERFTRLSQPNIPIPKPTDNISIQTLTLDSPLKPSRISLSNTHKSNSEQNSPKPTAVQTSTALHLGSAVQTSRDLHTTESNAVQTSRDLAANSTESNAVQTSKDLVANSPESNAMGIQKNSSQLNDTDNNFEEDRKVKAVVSTISMRDSFGSFRDAPSSWHTVDNTESDFDLWLASQSKP